MFHTLLQKAKSFYHLCDDTFQSALGSCLIHLKAEADQKSVIVQYFDDATLPIPDDAILIMPDRLLENCVFIGHVRKIISENPDVQICAYSSLPQLARYLFLADRRSVRIFAEQEGNDKITTQSLLLRRLYIALGHIDFAAHIAHRLFSTDNPYIVLLDDDAIATLIRYDAKLLKGSNPC